MVLALFPLAGFSQSTEEVSKEMGAAASAWLQSLDGPQRERAVFPLEDSERENWHYVPRARQGIPLKARNSQK